MVILIDRKVRTRQTGIYYMSDDRILNDIDLTKGGAGGSPTHKNTHNPCACHVAERCDMCLWQIQVRYAIAQQQKSKRAKERQIEKPKDSDRKKPQFFIYFFLYFTNDVSSRNSLKRSSV